MTLRTATGLLIPFPRGRLDPVENPVHVWGDRVLDLMYPDYILHSTEKNQAMLKYKALRNMSPHLDGWWVAVAANGSHVVAETEEIALKGAELLLPPGFYIDCMRREILETAIMDTSNPASFDAVHSSIDFSQSDLNGQHSAVTPTKEFILGGSIALDGKKFTDVVWKHDTGATHVGVPNSFLSDLPLGVKLQRGKDMTVATPFGLDRSNVYKNVRIKVAGLTTLTDILQARTFLLGYPIISRYENTLNVRAAEPVKMVPLSGESDQ